MSDNYYEAPLSEYELSPKPILRQGYSCLPDVISDAQAITEEFYLASAGTDLIRHPFFRGVDRNEGKSKLRNAQPGTYIIRGTTMDEYLAVLMVKCISKVANVPIIYDGTTCMFALKYHDDKNTMHFSNMGALLDHYTNNDVIDCPLLSQKENHIVLGRQTNNSK